MRNFLHPATIISSLPNTLANGQVADATPLMSDLNHIVDQVNANAAQLSLTPQLAAANTFTAVQAGIAATAATHFPIASQIQNDVFRTLTSTLGTNTITARNATLTLSALANGQIFSFVPSQTNTGPVTLNPDGVGATTIFLGGTNVISGQIVKDVPLAVRYESPNFHAIAAGNPATLGANTFSGPQTFNAAITYGGVTLSNAVTGTGNMVLSASPTLSGTVGGALSWSGAQTFSAGAVIAASQALTGTVASSTISGFLSVAATTGTFTNIAAFAGITAAFTKAAAGDVISFTNGGATPKTGYFNSNANNVSWMTGAGQTGTGIILNPLAASGTTIYSPNQANYLQVNDTNTNITGAVTMSSTLAVTGATTLNSASSRAVDGLRIGADSTNNLIDDASTGAGTATLYIGNASINVTSDENLKYNIQPFKSGLALVKQLQPIEFDQDENRPFGHIGHYVGFGARAVQKVAPWAVHTQGDTGLPWQARYEFLMAPVVGAVQELAARLEALERQQ